MRGSDLSLSTCTGFAETVRSYTLAGGYALEFIDAASGVVRSYPDAKVFEKVASPAACGGIGTWSAPAAQVAASFSPAATDPPEVLSQNGYW